MQFPISSCFPDCTNTICICITVYCQLNSMKIVVCCRGLWYFLTCQPQLWSTLIDTIFALFQCKRISFSFSMGIYNVLNSWVVNFSCQNCQKHVLRPVCRGVRFSFSRPPAWTNPPGTGPGFWFPDPLAFSSCYWFEIDILFFSTGAQHVRS